jgi:hypothetical protein
MANTADDLTVGVLGLHVSKETKAILNAVDALGYGTAWLRRENTAVAIEDDIREEPLVPAHQACGDQRRRPAHGRKLRRLLRREPPSVACSGGMRHAWRSAPVARGEALPACARLQPVP